MCKTTWAIWDDMRGPMLMYRNHLLKRTAEFTDGGFWYRSPTYMMTEDRACSDLEKTLLFPDIPPPTNDELGV